MELFDKIDVIGSEFIQENSKGHILSRLNNDLMVIKGFVSSRLSEIYAQILLIAFVFVLILMTDSIQQKQPTLLRSWHMMTA